MLHKYLKKIEFDKIQELLANFAVTSVGKEFALTITPYSCIEDAQKALDETTQSYILLNRKGDPPLVDFPDISLSIKALESGNSLSAFSLLQLANILKLARNLKEYFYSDIDISFCSQLVNLFSSLYSNPKIEETIFASILDENLIDDYASQTLLRLRKGIQKTESDIRQKLSSYLHSNYVQDSIITIRAGRFVIPVKQEYRSKISGFIHDISSSGSTIFIEPTTVFEMNNSLNQLKLEESIEIERILQQLSSLFSPIVEELRQNIICIGKIDFAFAKSKYAININATEPILHKEKSFCFQKARHPLIPAEKVVPITISLGKEFYSLVVTGPNTGGKTVTLKTVGLLCAMASSGLYIPASESSCSYVFDNIYADIGDNQSIQESLSTFSSHMTNIIDILNSATSNSLVLLDELGSGTDPVEGASLAISLLKEFREHNILTISTTHYPEVKNFALVTAGFENASSEFDVNNLKPTYRLLIGVPGQSNAFAISERLGLNPRILNQAKSLINSDNISFEELLKHIYDDKKLIENEKEKILQNSKDIELLKLSLEQEKSTLSQEKNGFIEEAKIKAREIFIEAKAEADEIIRNLSKETSQNNANILRKKIKEKITELSDSPNLSISTSFNTNDIHIGDSVFIRPLNTFGNVLGLPDRAGKVHIQVGNTKIFFSIAELEKVDTPKEKVISNFSYNSSYKASHISPEINLIGCNVEEANLLLDKYLDDCTLFGLHSIRIIHGKGTGVLRNGIHTFLKKHPHVKKFRIGTFGEGETGVTIVELQ